MKMIVAVPVALLTLGMLGCSQHSTAPAVERPAAAAPTANDTNTFGESKDEAAGSAASARAANYGSEPAAPPTDASPPAAAPADSTPPK